MSLIARLTFRPVVKLMTKYVAPQHDKEDGIGTLAPKKSDYSASDKLLFPKRCLFFIFVPLWTRADNIVNVKEKGSASNALNSLAGQTDDPRYGWRRPRY
jgi:hypothetical protein